MYGPWSQLIQTLRPEWIGLLLLAGLIPPLVLAVLVRQFEREMSRDDQVADRLADQSVNPDQIISSRSPVEEIEQIRNAEIPDLLQKLPSNNWHKETWNHKGDRWRYVFECNSESRRFFASALGASPMEAYLITKHRLLAQIREWHRTRFSSGSGPVVLAGREIIADGPRVLIVDDDVDMALAMQTAFGQMGCQTEVATSHEGLHRKLAANPVDYIFLDWRLNGEVTAGQVMERAVRFIDTFSDLRQTFTQHRPAVITYSVLERNQIALPISGRCYFSHLDHWQKPMPFHEVVKRATELLSVNANGLGV